MRRVARQANSWQLAYVPPTLGTLDLLAGPSSTDAPGARPGARARAPATAANIDLQIASNLATGFRVEECLEAAERRLDVARRWRLGTMLPAAQVR